MALVAAESATSRVSFFGRLANDLTRQTLPPGSFAAALDGDDAVAVYKYDGYFVFSDLGGPGASYDIALSARFYQARILSAVTTATAMFEVTEPGEDEVYLVVTGVNPGQDRVTFEPLPFVPRIVTGSRVLGPGTIDTTLQEPLEGRNVDFANLDDVAGISSSMILRILRSNRLIMLPDPYYPFPGDSTLAVVTVVEDDPVATPVSGVALQIDQVNDMVPSSVVVAGLTLRTIVQPGPPPVTVVLGPDSALQTATDRRGRSVFYFSPDQPVTRLAITVTKPGYVATPLTMDLTEGSRQSAMIVLPRA